jgi:hypothetical protein
MKHIVLLGDSIFDNAVYVPGEPAIIDQLRVELPGDWQATLLAVDGHVTQNVSEQLQSLPVDASDLVISVGGNDALGHAHLVNDVESEEQLTRLLKEVLPEFRRQYATMLDAVMELSLHTTVCTIYDQCPFPEAKWRQLVPVALDAFDDIIQEEAGRHDIPVIELREICSVSEDYSHLSPIEPSAIGGMKIVRAIIEQLCRKNELDFND